MSIIKGILVYTFIFLGIVLGVGIILVGIMYLFPQVSVFGYKFYHGASVGDRIYYVAPETASEGEGENKVFVNADVLSNVEAVVIQAEKWNVCVKYYDSSDISEPRMRVEMTRSITGFISTKTPNPTFSVIGENKALTGESTPKNVVTFQVNEPKGLYFNRSAIITVWLPSTLFGSALENMSIESGSGKVQFAQDTIASGVPVGDPQLNVNYLNINNKSGDVDLKHTNVLKGLSLTSSDSTFSVDRDLNCNVQLDLNKGKYEFKNITNATNSAEVVINSVNSNIILANVEGNLTLKTDYGFFRAVAINGNFSSLSHNTKDNNNACDLNIQKILGAVIIQNGSGKISIGQVGVVASNSTITDMKVDTKSGDLTVDNCFAKKVEITSTSGVIRLNNCLGSINANTTYGSVYAAYMKSGTKVEGVSDSDVANAIANLSSKTTAITTGDGKGNGAIEVYNSQGVLNLNSKGSGKIVAHLANLTGENSIVGNNSNINIIVPETSKFWLKWKASSSADLRIVTFTSTEKTYNSSMSNYDQTRDAVFMGGTKDATVNNTMTVTAGKSLVIYSTQHANLA